MAFRRGVGRSSEHPGVVWAGRLSVAWALEDIDATLVQFSVSPGSRLVGVEVAELRLPAGVGLSLVLRDGAIFVPGPTTVLRAGDHALVAAARKHHPSIERRLRAVSHSGRLAGWYADLPEGARP